MICLKNAFALIVALPFFLVAPVSYASPDCPAKISIVEKGVISPLIAKPLGQVYAELGCPLRLDPVPGLRGIAMFNNGLVDGEVMRLPKVEKAYKREFVRSATPMFSLSYSLWLHPNRAEKGALPIGYGFGVVWHEDYVKGKNVRKFHQAADQIRAYNAGFLSGILIADLSVFKLAAKGGIKPIPVRGEVVHSSPMYHYLGAEFSPFMDRFSKRIKADNPFNSVVNMPK